jgi:hypothetical protein
MWVFDYRIWPENVTRLQSYLWTNDGPWISEQEDATCKSTWQKDNYGYLMVDV